MEWMILSKNNEQTNKKQKHIMAKKSRLGVPKEERGRTGMDGNLGFFWMQIVIFGMDGKLFNSINNFFLKEQGNVCDWVSLLYNRTWQNIVNQLCFNFFLKKRTIYWSSCHGLAVMNPTSIHEDAGSIPGFAQWVKDLVLLRAVV